MKEPFSLKNEAALLTEPIITGEKVIRAGFSLRDGGTSCGPFVSLNLGLHVGDQAEKVVRNRRILGKEIGFPVDQWVCAQQVHGVNIAEITSDLAGSGSVDLQSAVENVDGLYTSETDLLLALCFADCVPIYFYVKDPAVVGILHAGWRGTVQGGAERMVKTLMRAFRIPASSVHAIIGPAIAGPDYEVDQRVIAEVQRLDRSLWKNALSPHGEGHGLLDLRVLNRAILAEAGVPEEQIVMTAYSTSRRPDLFYSYRRDGGTTGRMIGFIGMKHEGVR